MRRDDDGIHSGFACDSVFWVEHAGNAGCYRFIPDFSIRLTAACTEYAQRWGKFLEKLCDPESICLGCTRGLSGLDSTRHVLARTL